MPIAIKELVKLVENFGYKVSSPENKLINGTSVVDELLGEFEEATPPQKTSTEYLQELRESGYRRY